MADINDQFDQEKDLSKSFDQESDQKPADLHSSFENEANLTNPNSNNTPAYTKLESAARGALQGAMPFADELAGAYESPKGALKALSGLLGRDVSKDPDVVKYVEARNSERQKNAEARTQNPKSYVGGEVAGGLGTLAIPAGALAKAGKLKALLAPETIAESGLLGGLYGLGGSEAPLEQGDVKGVAKDTGIGTAIGAVLPEAVNAAGAVANKGVQAAKSIPFAGNVVSATEAGLKGKFFGSEEAKRKAAEQLSDTVETQLLDPTSQLRQTIGGGIGTIQDQAAARGTEVNLAQPLQQAQEAAKNVTPGLATEENASITLQNQINRYLKGMNPGEEANVGIGQAQKIKRDLQNLNEQMTPEEAGDIKPIVGQAAGGVKEAIQGAVPELGEANKSYGHVMDALGSLDINPTILNKMRSDPTAATDLRANSTQLLANLKNPNLRGVEVQDKFNNFLDNIRQIPDVGPDLAREMDQKLSESVKDYSLSRKIGVGGLSEASFLTGSMSWLGNLAGYGASKVGQLVTPEAVKMNSGSFYPKVGSIGELEKEHKDTARMSNFMFNQPDNNLIDIGNQVKQIPDLRAIGDSLVNAINNKNEQAKNAAIFTLMQNPQARALLRSYPAGQ